MHVILTSAVAAEKQDMLTYYASKWNKRFFTNAILDLSAPRLEQESAPKEEVVAAVDELVEQLDELAACVRGSTRPETDGAGAVSVIAVLEAIVQASKTHLAVDVQH